MFRRGAPSQQNNTFKNPRQFQPPIAKTTSTTNTVASLTSDHDAIGSKNSSSFENQDEDKSSTIQLAAEPSASSPSTFSHNGGDRSASTVPCSGTAIIKTEETALVAPSITPKKAFTTPSKFVPTARVPPGFAAKERAEEDTLEAKYFQVVWCNWSNKKHIKWEGDAFLMVRGKTAMLKDPEGKDFGRSSSLKISSTTVLGEGDRLDVCGKQIEIVSTVSTEDWTSGKCFLIATVAQEATLRATQYNMPKLVNPAFRGVVASLAVVPPQIKEIKPRHDPSLPGSLVMRRPTKEHMKRCNRANLPVVDVVVDPYLSAQLRPHQMEGVAFLYECLNELRDFSGSGAILADEMGLGKTIQCISLIWTMMKQGMYGGTPTVRRSIVICPGALVKNWEKEFRKWLGVERILVYAVSPEKKFEDFLASPAYQVLIISYEMMIRNIEGIRKVKFDLLICDEAHRLKNTEIKKSSTVMSIDTRRRIALTGTPIQNDLSEFFAIVEFVNPGVLGTPAIFRRVYEEPIVQSKQPDAYKDVRALGEARATELSRIVSMFCLRRTDEINNKYLPPKCGDLPSNCAASSSL